jgi:hypothetical protein
VRPDAYLIVAAGQPLYAPTPRELAEIAECAIEAGDEIERPRAQTGEGWRPLGGGELGRFLGLLAARIDPRPPTQESTDAARWPHRRAQTANQSPTRRQGRPAVPGRSGASRPDDGPLPQSTT